MYVLLKKTLDDEQKKELRKYLCELLKKDSEIQSIIADISSGVNSNEFNQEINCVEQHNNEKIEKLLYENERLKQKIIDLQKEIENKDIIAAQEKNEIESKNKKLEIEYNELYVQSQKEKENFHNLSEQINVYRKNYSSLENIFEVYNSLGTDIYEQLERVLNATKNKAETIEELYSFGVQEGNIIALWDIIATNISKYETNGKLDDLVFIFNYFFDKYSKVSYKPIEMYEAKVGDMYDERIHTRTSESNAIGIIEKVILPGFSIGRNISKKALVRVR